MTLEELKLKRTNLRARTEQNFKNMDNNLRNMQQIIAESSRVADVAHNSRQILDNLEAEFESQTSLNGVDIKFLFFATALQCLRQHVLSSDAFRFHDDNAPKKILKKVVPREYHEIMLGSVPYDAIKGSKQYDLKLGGKTHRARTLGHDPLLGWVFGTLNIATSTLTMNEQPLFPCYNVDGVITTPTTMQKIFTDGFQLFSEDYQLIAVCVLRQAIHLGTDAFTKMGLPIPIINTISPDFSNMLMRNRIDLYSVTRSAATAMLINEIIAAIHGLFYDDSKYTSRSLYEVKTRKILSYSNLIASTSNVLLVAINASLGNGNALKSLDVGGIIVTIYRLIADTKFIREIKEEFVFGSFNRLIQGEKYDFEEDVK